MTTVLVLSGVSFLVLSVALRLVQRQERSRGPYARFVRNPKARMRLLKPLPFNAADYQHMDEVEARGTHFYGKNDKGAA